MTWGSKSNSLVSQVIGPMHSWRKGWSLYSIKHYRISGGWLPLQASRQFPLAFPQEAKGNNQRYHRAELGAKATNEEDLDRERNNMATLHDSLWACVSLLLMTNRNPFVEGGFMEARSPSWARKCGFLLLTQFHLHLLVSEAQRHSCHSNLLCGIKKKTDLRNVKVFTLIFTPFSELIDMWVKESSIAREVTLL